MAIADFEFKLVINDQKDNVIKLIQAFLPYIRHIKSVYFNNAKIKKDDGNYVDLENYESLVDSDGMYTIYALGPYGRYIELIEIEAFIDMANSAPNSSFKGEINGNTTYNYQNLNCEMINGQLHIHTFFESNDFVPEAYVNYFKDIVGYKDFLELLNIDENDFCEDDYDDFIYDNFIDSDEYFNDMSVDELSDALDVDIETDELLFNEKMGNLDIMNFIDFQDEIDSGEYHSYIYDPITKEYILKK